MYAIQLLGKNDSWYVPIDMTGRMAFYDHFENADRERRAFSGPSRVVEVKALTIEPIVTETGTIKVFDIKGQPGFYRELGPNEVKDFNTIAVQEPGKDVRCFKRVS
jgi:hypothetical protein